MPVRQCSRHLWRSAAARVLACLCEGLPPMLGNRHLIFCHGLRQEIGKAPCVPVYVSSHSGRPPLSQSLRTAPIQGSLTSQADMRRKALGPEDQPSCTYRVWHSRRQAFSAPSTGFTPYSASPCSLSASCGALGACSSRRSLPCQALPGCLYWPGPPLPPLAEPPCQDPTCTLHISLKPDRAAEHLCALMLSMPCSAKRHSEASYCSQR